MMDDTTALAELEPETPEVEQPADDEENVSLSEIETEESEEPEQTEGEEGEEPAIDLADVEYEGKQYKLPPELKDALLRQADYTRKTQETAAKAKELDERAQRIEQQSQVSEAELEARAELHGINKRLSEYQNVNWQQLQQEDPMGAQAHWMEYQTMERRAQQLGGALQQVQQQRLQEAQQETAKRIEATREFAQKNIKGWSPEIDTKVAEFATTVLPFTRDQVEASINPGIYQALYLAWVGHQAISKQNTAPKRPAPAPQPLTTVNSKSNPTARKSLADMDMEEYAAARRAGRAG